MNSTAILLILGAFFSIAGAIVVLCRRFLANLPPNRIQQRYVEREGWEYKEFAELNALVVGVFSLLFGVISLLAGVDRLLTDSSRLIVPLVAGVGFLGLLVIFILYFFRLKRII